MKKLALVLVLIMSMLVLCSCGLKLTEGTCVDKRYTEAYTYRWVQIIPAGKVMVPVWHKSERPEKWEIEVSGITEEGETTTEWWQVPQCEYNKVNIGDAVKRCE